VCAVCACVRACARALCLTFLCLELDSRAPLPLATSQIKRKMETVHKLSVRVLYRSTMPHPQASTYLPCLICVRLRPVLAFASFGYQLRGTPLGLCCDRCLPLSRMLCFVSPSSLIVT
jgi:hypothetical protein